MKFLIYPILLATAVFGLTPAVAAVSKPMPVAAKADWTKVVSATPEGGYAMGNPKAKVHIIEYASYTCPHCSKFHADSAKGLDSYIRSGQVQFEFRSTMIHGVIDVIPTMVTYCQTPQRFFSLTNVFYNHFDEWTGAAFKNLQTTTQAEQDALKGKPALVAIAFNAKKSGVADFLRKQGLPQAQFNKCISNPKTLDIIQNSAKIGNDKYQIQATPTFIINGDKLEIATGTEPWVAVETKIKSLK